MPAMYCFSCSEKIIYDVFKPKECPHCKQSPHAVDTAMMRKPIPQDQPVKRGARPQRPSRFNDYEDDYEEDVTYVPDVRQLKARIDIGPTQVGEKFGSIIDSEINTISAQGSKKGRGRPKKIKPPQKTLRGGDGRSFEDYLREGSGEARRTELD